MAKYIDRDAFLSHERTWYCDNCDRRKNSKGKTVYEIGEAPCRACDIGDILDLLEDYPDADVVEVVRCKECDMAKPTSDEREMYCTFDHCYKGKNYFCADGRKKNEGTN